MKNPLALQLFTPSMKMAALMDTDLSILGVFNRLGLKLGFGEASVADVCKEAGIDPETFLLICRVYLHEGYMPSPEALAAASLWDILKYLRSSHSYYLESMLPAVENALERMIAACDSKQQHIIRKFFTDYKEELAKHFAYEENTVFPYVEAMLNSEEEGQYTIGEYEQNHTNVQEKLSDLKNLLMMYLPEECNRQEASLVLFYLFHLEQDLQKHTLIEDDILVPVVGRLEDSAAAAKPEGEELSAREKEILVCVANGMLNKEIADKFCISIYTVITHRKNITRKTGIKTVAGLTVYALLNNLITIE